MESSGGAAVPNWTEAVEDFLLAGEADKAISLLETTVSNLENDLVKEGVQNKNGGFNPSFLISDQLCIALNELSKLYSGEGLSDKAEETLSRSLEIKHRKRGLCISLVESTVSNLENEQLENKNGGNPSKTLHDLSELYKGEGLPDKAEETLSRSLQIKHRNGGLCMENQSVSDDSQGQQIEDWETLADRAPEELYFNAEDDSKDHAEEQEKTDLKYGLAHVLVSVKYGLAHVLAGEVDKANLLLESTVSNLENDLAIEQLQNKNGGNLTDQLSIALHELSKLYSGEGFSDKVEETLSRSLQIKYGKGGLCISLVESTVSNLENEQLQNKNGGNPSKTLHDLSKLYYGEGFPDKAEETLSRSLQIKHRNGDYDGPLIDVPEDDSKDHAEEQEKTDLKYGLAHVRVLALKGLLVIGWASDTTTILAICRTPRDKKAGKRKTVHFWCGTCEKMLEGTKQYRQDHPFLKHPLNEKDRVDPLEAFKDAMKKQREWRRLKEKKEVKESSENSNNEEVKESLSENRCNNEEVKESCNEKEDDEEVSYSLIDSIMLRIRDLREKLCQKMSKIW